MIGMAGIVVGVLNSIVLGGGAEDRGCLPLPFSEVRAILETPSTQPLIPELESFEREPALKEPYLQKLLEDLLLHLL